MSKVTEIKSANKYDSLPEGWEKIVLTMYSEGASDTEVRGELRITTNAWKSLVEDINIATFGQVVDFGKTLSKAWWMREGRQNLATKGFNATLWLMNMKNRFGWTDKQEVTSKSAEDMSVEEVDAAISSYMQRFKKQVK